MEHNENRTEASVENDNVGNPRRLYPAVAMYGPFNIQRSLKPGDKKKWCTCGLSKNQPWCDGSHIGTDFKPLTWVVPEPGQSQYEICGCKYTGAPPFCDGTHTSLPLKVIERKKNCPKIEKHSSVSKLCSNCGWIPDW